EVDRVARRRRERQQRPADRRHSVGRLQARRPVLHRVAVEPRERPDRDRDRERCEGAAAGAGGGERRTAARHDGGGYATAAGSAGAAAAAGVAATIAPRWISRW